MYFCYRKIPFVRVYLSFTDLTPNPLDQGKVETVIEWDPFSELVNGSLSFYHW